MKKPTLSLTDFVDIIQKNGLPKATKVRQVKTRPDYEPAFDFYKPLRESIIEAHKNGISKQQFRIEAAAKAHPQKFTNYASAISGYCKWWGNKKLTWIEPKRSIYTASGIDIIVNPELGLEWNGEQYFIKLYLKDDHLAKNRAEIILGLLEQTLRKEGQNPCQLALLIVFD